MSAKTKVQALDSSFFPTNKYFINEQECKVVEAVLGLKNIKTKEQIVELRNAVVNHFHPITTALRMQARECDNRDETAIVDKQYDVVADKFSAIIGVIDREFTRRGWMH